jgi:hypothetical protein
MGSGWIDEGEKCFGRRCLAKVKRIRREGEKNYVPTGDCKVGTTTILFFLRNFFLHCLCSLCILKVRTVWRGYGEEDYSLPVEEGDLKTK